jgi:hypothetical protein
MWNAVNRKVITKTATIKVATPDPTKQPVEEKSAVRAQSRLF